MATIGANIYPLPVVNDIKQLTARFDMGKMFEQLFGYKALPYPGMFIPRPKIIGLEATDYAVDPAETKNPSLYTVIEGRRVFLPVWLDNVLMPICTIQPEAQKNIVSTPVNGGSGIVNELVRFDNWNITLRGIAIGYKGEFPEDVITMLNEIYLSRKAIEMKCAFTDLLLVDYKVIVRDLKFPEIKGSEHVVGFQMSLLEDKHIELIIE